MDKIPLKILIVEDEVIVRESIKEMLQELGYKVMGAVGSKEKALDLFNTVAFDLVLLDINLDGKSEGIELAEHLQKEGKSFLFLTSYSDPGTIAQSKKTAPAAFLLKPFTIDDLFATIEIARIHINPSDENHLWVKDGHDKIKIPFDEIQYIQSANVYVEIHTTTKKHLQREPMAELLKKLPDYFFQIHRSYAVNSRFVTGVSSRYVYINDLEFPLSKSRKDVIKDFK